MLHTSFAAGIARAILACGIAEQTNNEKLTIRTHAVHINTTDKQLLEECALTHQRTPRSGEAAAIAKNAGAIA